MEEQKTVAKNGDQRHAERAESRQVPVIRCKEYDPHEQR
jgi:hypothetical protein